MEDDKFIPDLDMNVPVAYAAFEVVMDEEKKKAIDTIYVYVNKAYCEMVGKDKSELLGRSFLSVYDNADENGSTTAMKRLREKDTEPHVQPGSGPLAGI